MISPISTPEQLDGALRDRVVCVIERVDDEGEETPDWTAILIEDRQSGKLYLIDRDLWEANLGSGYIEGVSEQ